MRVLGLALCTLIGACDRREAATPATAPTATSIILATTTSTQDSGLLDVLMPEFEKQSGIEVKVIAVGSGAALAMAAKGDADVVLAHAPAAEQKLVDSGDLVEGRLVMHNDFVIAGPPEDPAGVKGAADLDAAMKAIAAAGGFVSRGDDSGTHKKESELWTAAGVDPRGIARYEQTGQGMGATLNVADQRKLYTLTDRGTYLAQKRNLGLAILSQGAPSLLNVYHVHVVSPTRHPKVKADAARKVAAFFVAPETQRSIGEFKRAEYGEPLFIPDAGKDPAALGLKNR
jgi:tungstate transport system substrate-binding protein